MIKHHYGKGTFRLSIEFLASLGLALLLVACGGGGGGSSATSDTGQQASNLGTTTTPPASSTPQTFTNAGTISGFGSIIVDGQRYETTSATTSDNGIEGPDTQGLGTGMKVVFIAETDADGVRSARQIYYDADAKGVVSAIDRANRQLTVQSITVDFDDLTHFRGTTEASLAVGDLVEISGYTQSNGILLATYIEVETNTVWEASQVLRSGFVSGLNTTAQTFSLGEIAVSYASATYSFSLDNGLGVRVLGQMNNSVLEASEIEPLASDDLYSGSARDDYGSGHAEIEGIVTAYSNAQGTIAVDGRPFSLASNVNIVSVSGTVSLGNLVEIYLDTTSNQVIRIDVENDRRQVDGRIKGQIEVIDAASQSVTVQSRVYRVSADTRYEDDDERYFNFAEIQVGDYAEISYREDNGTLYVQRLEREYANEYVEVGSLEGRISSYSSNSRQLIINGVTVQLGDTTSFHLDDSPVTESAFYTAIDAQQCAYEVEVKGQYATTGIFQARFVECDDQYRDFQSQGSSETGGDGDADSSNDADNSNDDDGQSDRRGYFELEGRVSQVASESAFLLNSREIRFDGNTRIENNDQYITAAQFRALLTSGLRVEVEGYWTNSAYVVATEIEVEND